MEISPERIESFRSIYLARFGIELTPQEALEKAIALLTMMKAVYRPVTQADLDRVRVRQSLLNKSS